MSASGDRAAREAAVFGRYILGGREAGERAVDLYVRALEACAGGWDGSDAAVAGFVIERPRTIGAIDGALALVRPRSLLRKKLLLMAAILETQPEHCEYFLPSERPRWYALFVAATAIRAALQTGAGLLLLPFIR